MDSRALKRVTVFAGHYGSGKTNVSVNYALKLKDSYDKVAMADLDIVNPYFRSKDASDILSENGVRLICSEYANTNVDTPALPAEAYSLIHDRSTYAVIDVGGDDRGALALGRYAPAILEENNYEALFVINKYRYLTKDPESTVEVLREIEQSAGIAFTGIVNNSNVGSDTTVNDVLDSAEYANKVSELTGLEVKFTTVKEELYSQVSEKISNTMAIRLYVRQSFDKKEE